MDFFDDLDELEDANAIAPDSCAAASKSKEIQDRLCAGALDFEAWPKKPWKEASAEAPPMKPLAELSEEEIEALPFPTGEQFKITKAQLAKIWDTQEPGVNYDFLFPHNLRQLRSMGPEWLTQAFHAAGTLPKDNSVTDIKEIIGLSMDPTGGEALGGAGIKVLLTIEYAKSHPDLHTELFIKMPAPYTPQSERYANVAKQNNDEPEILAYRLLASALPCAVPKAYFGDMSRKNGNALLILQKLNFSRQWKPLSEYKTFEIHPLMDKNKDYQITEQGRKHYPALARALAKLHAAYHSGKLGSTENLQKLFLGFDDQAKSMLEAGWPPASLKDPSPETLKFFEEQSERTMTATRNMCITGCQFVLDTCPQLFPPELRDRQFLRQFVKEASHVAQYEAEMNLYFNSDWNLHSLTHMNCQLDNAFYYNNEEGQVEAGLLDFGGFMFSNPVNSMARNWIAAEPEVMDDISGEILDSYIDELAKQGGPSVDRSKVFHIARLTQAGFPFSTASMLTIAGFAHHSKKDPFWSEVTDRWDPRIQNAFTMRFTTSNWRNTLQLWKSKERAPYKSFLKWLEENPWLPEKKPVPPVKEF